MRNRRVTGGLHPPVRLKKRDRRRRRRRRRRGGEGSSEDGESKTVARRRWETRAPSWPLFRSSCCSRLPRQKPDRRGSVQSCFSHPHARVDAPDREEGTAATRLFTSSSCRRHATTPPCATLTIALVIGVDIYANGRR